MTTAMAGLHLTEVQLSDMDVDGLSVKIDKSFCDAKEAILDHVLGLKARLLSTQTQAIEEERRSGARLLAAKQEEVTLLKAELEVAVHSSARHADFSRRLAGAYDQSKAERRGLQLRLHAFYAWRQLTQAHALRRARLQRAEVWYWRVHLQRNVLRAWFRTATQLHRGTVADTLVAQVEGARQAAGAHAQAQLDALRQQLREAGVRLEREAEARERLEENMKQAFMRGVCALNIEAMSIMKRGMPPGGANPVPLTLTVQHGGGGGGGGAAPRPAGAAGRAPMMSDADAGASTNSPHHHQQQQQQQHQHQQSPPPHPSSYLADVTLDVRGTADDRGQVDLRGTMTLSPPRPSAGVLRGGAGPGPGSSNGRPAHEAPPPLAAARGAERVGEGAGGGGGGGAGGTSGTAASYYQRQARVVVTRGPTAEPPPKPRPMVPLPTARQAGSAR